MIELIHPELANVSKTDIKAKLAQSLKSKEENISIFGLKTKFGGGRSTGFALVYDSLDARKKYDSKKMLRKVSLNSLTSPSNIFPQSFNNPLLYRTGTSLRGRDPESRERKSRAESRKSEVSLRPRREPQPARRSEHHVFTNRYIHSVTGLDSFSIKFSNL